MIAIIPAAGRGTRMAAIAAGASKEMLHVGGKPVIQWAIDEALDAGSTTVTVVSSPHKPDLNAFLAEKGVNVEVQLHATGLGPAIGIAASTEPALIVLPDTIYFPKSPSRRIARALDEGFEVVIPVETVAEDAVRLYGIVEAGPNGEIKGILEKPEPGETFSRLAIAGRFGLGSRIMSRLADEMMLLEDETLSGEIGLTDFLDSSMIPGSNIVLPLTDGEVRYDCGSPEGYSRAREVIE